MNKKSLKSSKVHGRQGEIAKLKTQVNDLPKLVPICKGKYVARGLAP
jgi:hypothetical protein